MRKAKIMVVDDEVIITTRLEERLTSMGYEVIGKASSGEEVLETARRLRPDLILMDIVMPGALDGIDASEKIKAEMDIPVIFLTAYTDDKFIKRAKNAEPFGYIVKPFRETEIKAAIEIALYKKDMERQLCESEKKYRSVVDNANDAIISADSHGNIIFWNKTAENIFGYLADETLGKPLTVIVPKRLNEAYQGILKRAVSSNESKIIGETFELSGVKKDGSEFPMEFSYAIWKARKGNFFTWIIRDITERKKMKDSLKKAYQDLKNTHVQLFQAGKLTAMGEMAAGVVHELTQPLLGIKGFSTALLEDMKRNLPTETSQQAIADIDVILQQTDRMMKILNMIREFARASGTEMLPLDINKPGEDALLLFSEQLRIHNIVVEKNLARALPPVMGNANQMQQVFINLIANARDAIGAKGGEGRLTVSTEMSPTDASILIEVIDNGIGADAETLSKMFDPFFTNKKPGGSAGAGLGLAIVARIVKEHKGTIDAQSKPGGGCKFSIRLPGAK